MKWAALIAWVLTAGGGFVMLAIWLQRGGMRQRDANGRMIRPPLILGHFGLAATGLVLWIIYLASDSDALGWIALVLLAIVALLGFTMLSVWYWQRQQRMAGAAGGAAAGGVAAPAAGGAGAPAEQHFPVPIVVLHGLLAVVTVVLVLLTDAGVGGS